MPTPHIGPCRRPFSIHLYLSIEYDTLEFVGNGKVKVEDSQGEGWGDEADEDEEEDTIGATVTLTGAEVKGYTIAWFAISAERS